MRGATGTPLFSILRGRTANGTMIGNKGYIELLEAMDLISEKFLIKVFSYFFMDILRWHT